MSDIAYDRQRSLWDVANVMVSTEFGLVVGASDFRSASESDPQLTEERSEIQRRE